MHKLIGIGMLLAPLLVSWDVAENDTFHNAYMGCAAVAAVVSIPIILLPVKSSNTFFDRLSPTHFLSVLTRYCRKWIWTVTA